MNAIIDRTLPGRPPWQCTAIFSGKERHELYHRDIIPCIRSLFGDLSFMHDLVFAPVRIYTTSERKCHVYNEIHTGDWWWAVQVRNKTYYSVTLTNSY
jgi:hypothetical protein